MEARLTAGLLLVPIAAFGSLLAYAASLSLLHLLASAMGRVPGSRILSGPSGVVDPVLALGGAMMLVLLVTACVLLFWRPDGVLRRGWVRLRADLVGFAAELRSGLSATVRSLGRPDLVALIVVLVAALALRLRLLAQPVRYDEAVTFLEYASTSLPEVLSLYRLPNNHLLHSALVRLSTLVFGEGPVAVRLPALAAGFLTVPAVFLVGRLLFDARAGLLAAAVAAVSPALVLFSTNARGYSLVILAFLVLVLLARRLSRRRSLTGWAFFCLVAVLGCHAVPVMLYPLSGVVGWLLLVSSFGTGPRPGGELARETLTVTGVAGALTAWLYAPPVLVSGAQALFANRFVVARDWESFVSSVPGFLEGVWSEWNHGMPPVLTLLLVVGLLAGLWRSLTEEREAGLLILACLVGCAVVLVANRRSPFPRVWLYLFPLFALVAGAGWSWMVRRWASEGRFGASILPAVAVALAVGVGALTVVRGTVIRWPLTGSLPAGREVAELLEGVLNPGDAVAHAFPSGAPLRYYFRRRGIPAAFLTEWPRPGGTVYVVVNRRHGQSLEELVRRLQVRDPGGRPRVELLERDGVAVYALLPVRSGVDARTERPVPMERSGDEGRT